MDCGCVMTKADDLSSRPSTATTLPDGACRTQDCETFMYDGNPAVLLASLPA